MDEDDNQLGSQVIEDAEYFQNMAENSRNPAAVFAIRDVRNKGECVRIVLLLDLDAISSNSIYLKTLEHINIRNCQFTV